MNPEVARRTRATLELKLSEASAKAVEIATERQRISFDAATGDATARKALDEANAASMTVSLELENLRSAIEEAKRRLSEACLSLYRVWSLFSSSPTRRHFASAFS